MKKLAIFIVAAVMALSLVACGCQADRPAGNNGATSNDSANNGAANGSVGNNGGMTGNGPVESTRPDGSAGNDLQDAVDDVGDAMGDVGNAVGDAADAILPGDQNGPADDSAANTTTFQRMLDNARVHDADGDLTDGENSRR